MAVGSHNKANRKMVKADENFTPGMDAVKIFPEKGDSMEGVSLW
jgi:hypothetical protein